MASTVLILSAIAMLIASVPIFLALLTGTVIGFEFFGPPMPPVVLAQRLVEGVNVFSILAVPLFVYAADIISRGEIGERLVRLMESLVGHITGGLAIATVLTCAMFGAISGIGAAAVVSIGPIVYPSLLRHGYSRGFSVGLILTASTLSMLIPPSVAMILYSVQVSVSVSQVFLTGLATGIIFVVGLSAYCVLYAVRNKVGRSEKVLFREQLLALRRGLIPMGLPALIFGGIYGGVFTPTEAAAAACVYAALVETIVFRRLKLRSLFRLSQGSSITIATLLILIAAGSTMTWFMTLERVPAMLAAMMSEVPDYVVLAAINVLVLIIGMFIDPNSAVIVISPLIAPAAVAVGVDAIHLGAIIVFNLAIGMITPPFGLNIFIGMSTFKIGYGEILRAVLPFIGVAIVTLLIITYIPQLVMWLPELAR
ncbi:TRAP transporter large permease [Mariluticola halotolerans]|uniref:TRAP transporter large permease n=1 Tax=Mariluticola halotolerans TaxID=2909283 RepID=UPI0026E28115|nr:TRAP transporter large permease [Mariluticola halotolerans]UJQ95127.1 TRAP transporter large permease [Mariluticola halotolerans]